MWLGQPAKRPAPLWHRCGAAPPPGASSLFPNRSAAKLGFFGTRNAKEMRGLRRQGQPPSPDLRSWRRSQDSVEVGGGAAAPEGLQARPGWAAAAATSVSEETAKLVAEGAVEDENVNDEHPLTQGCPMLQLRLSWMKKAPPGRGAKETSGRRYGSLVTPFLDTGWGRGQSHLPGVGGRRPDWAGVSVPPIPQHPGW